MKNLLNFTAAALLAVTVGMLVPMGSGVQAGIEGVSSNSNTSIENTIVPADTDYNIEEIQNENKDFRAFWVATVYSLDYPNKQTTDEEELKKQALEILDYAKENGYNAVIFQVRPSADSFFKSQYFPWSRFLTGEQGKAPANGFDPLAFFVEQAHNRGIELHAWLNPYRVTKKDSGNTGDDFEDLADTHPAKLHPEWTVKYSDGNLYFDPGIPEVRELIVESIKEIVQNYDVDGIHFDDYFYPGAVFHDEETFKKYGAGYDNVSDFRRDSVSELVKQVGEEIEKINPNCRFGISPFGIWANKKTNPLGSDTNGGQSYYDHYADTRRWVKEGYVDYIAPQLYWNIGNASADYEKLLNWWIDTVKDTGVDLYIGQAAYRSGDSSETSAWYGTTEIENQLKMNFDSERVQGSIFFRYKFLKASSELTKAIYTFYQSIDNAATEVSETPRQDESPVIDADNASLTGGSSYMLPLSSLQKLSVARPSLDISTSYTSFYITGASDPEYPLYINGEEVTGRSALGFYGKLIELSDGDNKITVEQNGNKVVRSIYKGVTSSSVSEMEKAEITATSVFPQNPEYRQIGEKITLKCTAPAGAAVTVTLNGETFKMHTSSAKRADGKIAAAAYTYSYTVPDFSGKAKIIDLGKPVYKMTFEGKTDTKTAPYEVKVVLKNAPFYATITSDVADTKTSATSTGYDNFLYKGMRAIITGMTGKYVRLGQGCWVSKSDVSMEMLDKTLYPVVTEPEYSVGLEYDMIKFKTDCTTSAIAAFDGKVFTVKAAPALRAENIKFPDGALFSSSRIESGSGYEKYYFTVAEGASFEGFYVQNTDEGFAVYIKHRKKVSESSPKPLEGIKIVVDAGHGGSDNGALGSMGKEIAEKDINLAAAQKTAEKLRSLGATVIMTRTQDEYITLQERQQISFAEKPDLFLSIHANSLDDNKDISKVEGLSVFYKREAAKSFAESIFNTTKKELERDTRGLLQSNLYVARASWTPSVIYESGFIPNPSDFEWLISEDGQQRLADSIANSIIKYFS